MLAVRRFVVFALFVCAAIGSNAAQSHAQGRNCPESADQIVVVTPGQPVSFRLDVENLGDAQLSVFQYPLGGVLQQNPSSPLDFVFVPKIGFNGTTEMTYRIIPPFDCPRTVQLNRVQLVGGFTDGTAPGLVPTLPPTLCGIGSFAPLAMALLLISTRAIRPHCRASRAGSCQSVA